MITKIIPTLSVSVSTWIALGMTLAVFSFVIAVTSVHGTVIYYIYIYINKYSL